MWKNLFRKKIMPRKMSGICAALLIYVMSRYGVAVGLALIERERHHESFDISIKATLIKGVK